MQFKIEVVEFDQKNEKMIEHWRSLLTTSTSPEKIYQTPAFFDFLLREPATRDQAVLLTVSDLGTGDIKGIFPLRWIRQSFNFRLSSTVSLSPRVNTLLLLGSIPLVDFNHSLVADVLESVFSLFPDIDGLSFSALPRDSDFNAYLSTLATSSHYLRHVLDDWRDCHAIPLPETFEDYLSRYNAKKRFNLRRQVRLLREHSGDTLTLHAISKADQVEFYTSAWRHLAPPELTNKILSPASLKSIAGKGLLHAFVLTINGAPCAVISSTQAAGTLHVHNIIYDKELARFSVGTCILYLAIEHLIAQGHVKVIDLGYSNPAHSDRASNVVTVRGNMLVLRKTWRNRVLCVAHNFYTTQVPRVKRILNRYRS